MGFHIQMRNKVSYIKKLMEIAIDISKLVLFVHGYNTRLERLQNAKSRSGNHDVFVSLQNCNLH